MTSDIMGSYMMGIACILREIELMTLVDAMYIGYIDRQRMLCKPPSYANYGNSNLDHQMHVWCLGYLLLASLRCYLSFKPFMAVITNLVRKSRKRILSLNHERQLYLPFFVPDLFV